MSKNKKGISRAECSRKVLIFKELKIINKQIQTLHSRQITLRKQLKRIYGVNDY